MAELKVIKFEASWCAPCKVMKPVFDKVMAETNAVEFETVDIDKEADKAIDMNVMSVPTVILVKSGKVVDRFVGTCTAKDLLELINKWK